MIAIHLHDIALLATDGRPLPAPSASLVPHWIGDAAGIGAAHRAVGHRIADARLQRRLANGLAFVRFDSDGTAVATSWLAAAGGRYIDELNWMLPIPVGEFWLRDVFVAPACRGRRLFGAAVAALAMCGEGGPRRIWSDVDWDNAPSIRAHQAAGFSVLARVRALDVLGRLRLRSALPAWPLPVTEIEPRARLIWLRGARRQRHEELVA